MSHLDQLKRSFRGEIISPHSSSYPRARQVWNRAVDKYPAIIARCINRDDVAAAIEFARIESLPLAVRSGGHSFAGHGVSDGALVVDLSPMKGAEIDQARAIVRIKGGMLSGEIDDLSRQYGLATPLGSCPLVGVTGYALAGGEGVLTPKFGFVCDNMTSAEIVTADARVLNASFAENQDLFWAIRGAGANFGVVTELELQLHPVATVLSGHLRYPLDRAREVLGFLDKYASEILDDLSLSVSVFRQSGEVVLDLGVVWPGDAEEGERVIQPLLESFNSIHNTMAVRNYFEEQKASSSNPPHGAASRRRAGHFERLSDGTIDSILRHSANAPSQASGITMLYWHGPWCSKPRDDAFGFRRTGYEYWVQAYWDHDSERAAASVWGDEFFEALRPFSTGAVYVNDLEDEGPERVRAAYGDKYPRLVELKRKYDPGNLFRVNQNIPPM